MVTMTSGLPTTAPVGEMEMFGEGGEPDAGEGEPGEPPPQANCPSTMRIRSEIPAMRNIEAPPRQKHVVHLDLATVRLGNCSRTGAQPSHGNQVASIPLTSNVSPGPTGGKHDSSDHSFLDV